ncbi:MAG: F0F1 ATP synthase subunit delta [Gammaproteobacteria bacterium]
MQEKLTIARPYAAAAYAYASEHGEVDRWSGMLAALATAVAEPALATFIGHPRVSNEQIVDVLSDLLGDRLNDAGRNFLQALADAERLEIAPQVAELFERSRADAAGVVNVEVCAAYPLNDAERQKIETAIRGRVGRECRVEASVDPALIGGAVIRIGDSVIDLSMRGRLAALEQQLG